MITMPVFQITKFTKKNFSRNTCTKARNILQSFDDTIFIVINIIFININYNNNNIIIIIESLNHWIELSLVFLF